MKRLEMEQWGGKVCWLDRLAGRGDGQVAGGIGWARPPQPGFLVVVGEEARRQLETGRRVLWVLAEHEARQMSEMYRLYRELSEAFGLQEWYGNPKNKAMMHLFRSQQQEIQGETQLPLVVMGGPYHDHPQGLLFYVQTVDELTQSGRKLLFFGEKSVLPANIINLAPEQLTGQAEDYPPIAALGYAVSAMRLYGPAPAAAPEYRERESWSPYGEHK